MDGAGNDAAKMTTYDAMPYPSYSYPSSAPASLNAIARLFGMTPAEIQTARVLEIGCESGGNILPLAARYPNSEFVGIDLSKGQIDEAKEKAAALSLENLRFEAKSILDLKLKKDKFDYIIAHGFYSWVPSKFQSRLLEICGEHLSKNGVAYVSYNTLPGWNGVKTIRDMMLYHGRNFDDPAEKVTEARRMLNFVAENIKAASGPYKQTLEQEISILQKLDDNYLLHDHLEAVNEPCYFHEFMDKAAKAGLAYLGDADLPSMYLGNQAETVAETLKQMDDTVRQEQYMDFIANRRFRMTLLAKEGVGLNRNLTPESVKGLRFIPNYNLKQPLEAGVEKTIETLDLVGLKNPDQTANMTGRVGCVCYLELLKAAPVALPVDGIVEAACKTLEDVPKETVLAEFEGMVLRLIFSGIISITADIPGYTQKIANKPEVFKVARLLGLNMDRVPNMRHETVRLSDDQRVVLQYVNGENTRDEITEAVKGHIDKGEMTINADGKPLLPGTADLEKSLPQYIDAQLAIFAGNALLEA